MNSSTKLIRIVKRILFFSLAFCYSSVTAQQDSYPIRFEDGFTILFPSQPVLTKRDAFYAKYVAKAAEGTLTTIIEKYEDIPMLSSNAAIDRSDSGAIQWMSKDPNLGTLSDSEVVVKGHMRGRYAEFKLDQGEPALVIMFLSLSSIKSSNTYSISYQYWDDGNEPPYDKESFLALIQER